MNPTSPLSARSCTQSALVSAPLRLLSVSALLSAGILGCQAEDTALQLYGVVALDAMSCLPSTEEASALASGTFDLTLSNTYRLNLSVQSKLSNMVTANNFQEGDGRKNTTDVHLTHVEVRYVDTDGVDIGLDPVLTIPLTGYLEASSDRDPLVIPDILVFDQQMSELLAQNATLKSNGLSGPMSVRGSFGVTLDMTLFGQTIDGREVESNVISFPVKVCTACLVTGSCQGDVSITEADQKLLDTCPNAIGRDQTRVSCALCEELADPSLKHVCEP